MFISQKAIYIPRNMEAGTLGHGRLIYVKPSGVSYMPYYYSRDQTPTLKRSRKSRDPYGVFFLFNDRRFSGCVSPLDGPMKVAPGIVRLFWWDARSYMSVP